jgi:hypothetical protein
VPDETFVSCVHLRNMSHVSLCCLSLLLHTCVDKELVPVNRCTGLPEPLPAPMHLAPHNSAAAKTPQPIHTSPGPAQTPHTPTQPTAAATTQPKPRSGPHYGTEFFSFYELLKHGVCIEGHDIFIDVRQPKKTAEEMGRDRGNE